MIKIKPFAIVITVLVVVTLMIPTMLVLPFMEKTSSEHPKSNEARLYEGYVNTPEVDVAVYRASKNEIDVLPLEDYLIGVVAAEMPADFEMEALKAQALTARTYIVKQLLNKEKVGVPEGADITDTEMHQVYKSNEELQKQWGDKYKANYQKIKEAVVATSGQIVTYDGSPINVAFFSTSNGYTENSEDYWTTAEPYLKSVQSPWDIGTPKFNGQKEVTVADFEAKLGVTLTDAQQVGTVIERTAGNRVGKVDVNGKILTGKEIREALDLKSTDFTWERKGNKIVITTKGYGHGVGMSQYGANGMATAGKTYDQIVQHYYKGIEISTTTNLLTQATAKK